METNVKQSKKQCCSFERAELLLAYRHSGLSKKRMVRAQGVVLSTLGKWLKLEKEQTNNQIVQVLAPVMVSLPPPVWEESILLKAGKFSLTVGKNTDRRILLVCRETFGQNTFEKSARNSTAI